MRKQQQLNSRYTDFLVAYVLINALVAIGCDDGSFGKDGRQVEVGWSDRVEVNWDTSRLEVVDQFSLDLGVVLPSHQNDVCFPLSKFGIDRTNSVRRVDSSCSCVEPTVVRYVDERGEWNEALRLSFKEEPGISSEKDHTSVINRLSVAITLTLAGSQKVVAVDVLCVGAYELASPEKIRHE